MKAALKIIFISVFVISCGKGSSNRSSQLPTVIPSDDTIADTSPIEVSYQLENAIKENDIIRLQSFRYRALYQYHEGISSVLLPKETDLLITDADIKVYTYVEDADLSRVQGLKLKGSEQPWIQLSFLSRTSNEVVKVCLQIQPKATLIENAGLSEIELTRKYIVTILDDAIDCVGAQVDHVHVLSGIASEYLKVGPNTEIIAETKSDLKAGNQRVGTMVEFNMKIQEF